MVCRLLYSAPRTRSALPDQSSPRLFIVSRRRFFGKVCSPRLSAIRLTLLILQMNFAAFVALRLEIATKSSSMFSSKYICYSTKKEKRARNMNCLLTRPASDCRNVQDFSRNRSFYVSLTNNVMKQDRNTILRATSCEIQGCQPSGDYTGLSCQPSGGHTGL